MSAPMQPAQPHARFCGAKTRAGTPCRNLPVIGSTRCRMHGGRTPAGIASPHFRHGRRSKALPGRLLDRYREALADPELLTLRDEIALVDARIADLLGRVDGGESEQAWRQLTRALDDLEAGMRARDTASMHAAIGALTRVVRGATTDRAAWEEVVTLVDQRRRLVESEGKRLVAMQQLITAEQAMTFVAAVQDAIRRHVHDPAMLRAIADDLRVLTHHGTPYEA